MRLTGSRTYYRPSAPKMPPGLVELMEGLTKEVLKHNPNEIYAFCANHVQQLLGERDGPSRVKLLSLEEKITRAQVKVRQRAEIRKKEFDVIVTLHGESSNSTNNESNNSVMSHTVQVCESETSIETGLMSNKDTLHSCPQEQVANDFLVVPGQNNSNFQESSQVIVSDEHSPEYCNEGNESDVGDTKLTEAEKQEYSEVFINDNMTQPVNFFTSTSDCNINNNLLDLKDNSELITKKDSIDSEIITSNLISNNDHDTEEKQPIESKQCAIPDSNENTESNNGRVDIAVGVLKDNGTDKGKANNKTEECDTLASDRVHIEDAKKANDNIDIKVDSDAIEHPLTMIQQVTSAVEEYGFNIEDDSHTVTKQIYITNITDIKSIQSPRCIDELNESGDTRDLHKNDNARAEKSPEKKLETNVSYSHQEDPPVMEVNVKSTSMDNNAVMEITSTSDINLSAPETSTVIVPANNDEKNIIVGQLNMDHTEKVNVIRPKTRNSEFDSRLNVVSDLPTATQENNREQDNSRVSEIYNKVPFEDSEIAEEATILLDETISDRFANIHSQKVIDTKSTKLLKYSDTIPTNGRDWDNHNSKQKSTSPYNNENEVFDITNTDLERAAITIQKVFRSFLFKSRGSTLEDTANDETNLLDEGVNHKDECDFPIASALHIDRRVHGINRMDTVLQTVNEEKSLSFSTDDSSTLSSAATVIQAHVRGFLVRNNLNSNKATNSLVTRNSNEPSVTSLDADNDHNKSKTVLNIHIIPESGNYFSRDESVITSIDLPLDSPPSSINLHPSSDDKSDRRRRLKREDAIQSISPPSNNSRKLSEEIDSVKEIISHENAADERMIESNISKLDSGNVNDKGNTFQNESIRKMKISEELVEESNNDAESRLKQKRQSLTKLNSDEKDVVTPFLTNEDSGLLHSGEFHDAVVPTKVSRSDTSVVSEFKNVLVYFLLWNHS